MKKILEKIKLLVMPIYEKIKAWFEKNWFMVINYIILFAAFNIVYGKEGVVLAEVLIALWLFFSVGYAGWKWFNKK